MEHRRLREEAAQTGRMMTIFTTAHWQCRQPGCLSVSSVQFSVVTWVSSSMDGRTDIHLFTYSDGH